MSLSGSGQSRRPNVSYPLACRRRSPPLHLLCLGGICLCLNGGLFLRLWKPSGLIFRCRVSMDSSPRKGRRSEHSPSRELPRCQWKRSHSFVDYSPPPPPPPRPPWLTVCSSRRASRLQAMADASSRDQALDVGAGGGGDPMGGQRARVGEGPQGALTDAQGGWHVQVAGMRPQGSLYEAPVSGSPRIRRAVVVAGRCLGGLRVSTLRGARAPARRRGEISLIQLYDESSYPSRSQWSPSMLSYIRQPRIVWVHELVELLVGELGHRGHLSHARCPGHVVEVAVRQLGRDRDARPVTRAQSRTASPAEARSPTSRRTGRARSLEDALPRASAHGARDGSARRTGRRARCWMKSSRTQSVWCTPSRSACQCSARRSGSPSRGTMPSSSS